MSFTVIANTSPTAVAPALMKALATTAVAVAGFVSKKVTFLTNEAPAVVVIVTVTSPDVQSAKTLKVVVVFAYTIKLRPRLDPFFK